MKKEVAKCLIELSSSFEEADKIVEQYSSFTDTEGKLLFLMELWPKISFVGHEIEDKQTDYQILLHTIINAKWR